MSKHYMNPDEHITITSKEQSIQELKAEIDRLRALIRELETPDMFWDDSDTDQLIIADNAHDAAIALSELIAEKDGVTLELQCAKRLPNRKFKAFVVADHWVIEWEQKKDN